MDPAITASLLTTQALQHNTTPHNIDFSIQSSQAPSFTIIITSTTICHYHHHNHHHHSIIITTPTIILSSSQAPPSVTIIITTTNICRYHHHNHQYMSLSSSQIPPYIKTTVEYFILLSYKYDFTQNPKSKEKWVNFAI